MALNDDLKKDVQSMLTDFKEFLTFLDGFSLDKEIDDEAVKIREKTEKLESRIKGTAPADTSTAVAEDDELYTDTLAMEVVDDGVIDDVYEIGDEDTSQPPTPVTPKPAEKVTAAMTSKKPSKKEKALMKKESKGSSSALPTVVPGEEDENLSSGGSVKEIAVENISPKTWSITEDKDCSISGRLTKRSNPAKFSLVMATKVFAAIHGGVFYFFDKTTSKKQKGAFFIADYQARPYETKKTKQKEFIFQTEAVGKTTYYFSTQSEDPMKKWIDTFNKLAHSAKMAAVAAASQGDVTNEDDDIYELDDPNFVENERQVVEDIADEDDDDIYSDPIEGNNNDVIEECPPSPPARDKQDKAPNPPPARNVMLRVKPDPPPPRVPDDDIYDDGTSQLPSPPKSWIKDDDDQEIYDDVMTPPPPTMQNPAETFFYGKWDCTSGGEKELEFHHGDMIEIVERRYDSDGWWVGLLKGQVGLVPKSYLTPAYRKI